MQFVVLLMTATFATGITLVEECISGELLVFDSRSIFTAASVSSSDAFREIHSEIPCFSGNENPREMASLVSSVK